MVWLTSSTRLEANPSSRKIKCPADSKCCDKGRKCISDKSAIACRNCFIEVDRLRRNHKIKMDALKKTHKVEMEGLKTKTKISELKFQKLIILGEKRLSDERGALQKAATKDKQYAFRQGLLWGVGGTLAVVAIATVAIVIVLYVYMPTTTTAAKPLVFGHDPIF